MDLWIRSQDRTMLCKPQYIELCCDSEVHYGNVNIGYRCVATYKTKERALEVLDEINRHIEELYNCKYGIEYDLSQFTYEMPKE